VEDYSNLTAMMLAEERETGQKFKISPICVTGLMKIYCSLEKSSPESGKHKNTAV
jgi:hypothetical protein